MDDAARGRWEFAARRDFFRTRLLAGDPCPKCGEIVGHFGGSTERDACPLIPKQRAKPAPMRLQTIFFLPRAGNCGTVFRAFQPGG